MPLLAARPSIYAAHAPAGVTVYSESFNKADGALGPDRTWSNIGATAGSTVVSNAARAVANNHGSNIAATIATDAAVGADFDVRGTITITTSTADSVRGVALLGRYTNSGTLNGYRATVFYSVGSTAFRYNVQRHVAGAQTIIQADTTLQTASTGFGAKTYAVRFTGVGSTLTLYIDAVQEWTGIDANIASGDYCGFAVRHSSTSDTAHAVLDDWSAQAL